MSKTDVIYQEALEQVQRFREKAVAQGRAKVSSAPGTSDPRKLRAAKLSAARGYAADLERLGRLLENIGERGFEKTAMDGTGGGVGALSGENQNPNGSASPVDLESIQGALAGGGTSLTGDNGPAVTRPGRGGDSTAPPFDQGNTGNVVSPPGSQPNLGSQGTSTKDLSDGSYQQELDGMKVSSAVVHGARLLQKISGGRILPIPRSEQYAYLRDAMNLNVYSGDPEWVLKASASRRGMSLENFGRAIGLQDETMGDRWIEEYYSQMPYKLSSGDTSDLDKARSAVEQLVKARGELPTTEEVATAANVIPAAANAAIYQTAELIAAVGGTVAAPGQASGGAPPMPGVGAPPMGAPPMDPSMMMGAPPMDPSMMMGAPPMGAPPMGAPPMGAPPMDPSMMGGAPPMGAPPMGAPPMGAPPMGAPPMGGAPQGMQVTASVHPRRLGLVAAQLGLKLVNKLSASSELISLAEGEPQTGSSTSDKVVDPGNPGGSPSTFSNSFTDQDRQMLDSVLATPSSAMNVGPQDVSQVAKDPTNLDLNLSPVTTHGQVSTRGEQVSGGLEGDNGTSSPKDNADESSGGDVGSDSPNDKTSADLVDAFLKDMFGKAGKIAQSAAEDEFFDMMDDDEDPDSEDEDPDSEDEDPDSEDGKKK